MDTNTRVPGKGWYSFELESQADVRDALWWLNQSYESVKGGSSGRIRKRSASASSSKPLPRLCRKKLETPRAHLHRTFFHLR